MKRLCSELIRREEGATSASLELIFSVGFLLIPVAALLAQLPTWVQTQHAAQSAAIEAARQVVLADDMASGIDAANVIAQVIVTNHGQDAADVEAVLVVADPPGPLARGQRVTVSVTVAGSGFVVPGFGIVGRPFSVTRSATERVDDYRGFAP